jgi:sirohydrochlorin ferrochelatase
MKRAVLLVDHGSRVAGANAALDAVAAQLARRLPDRLVRVAHLEIAPPSIGEGIDACVAAGAREIVVHPYFLSPGRHTSHDIPREVEQAAARHPGVRVLLSPPLGPHEKLIELIAERVASVADAGPTGSAGS